MESGDGIEEKAEEADVDRDTSIENDSGRQREIYECKENGVYNSREVKESRQTKSKKEERGKSNQSLKSIVCDSKNEARASGIDETEYLGAHLHENISEYLEERNDSKAKEETWEGAVAYIYNKKSGEFLLEENPATYGVKEARGKLRLIGGAKESYDSGTLETLVRELEEEVEGEANEKLRKIARNRGTHYDTIWNVINGRLVKTDIYKIEANDREWESIRKAKPTHDTGYFHVLRFDEILSRPDSQFAFEHGPKIKEFIYNQLKNNEINLHGLLPYANYSLPLATTNYNSLNAINSFSNKPYISKN